MKLEFYLFFFFFQAEDGIRDLTVTGVQTCALPISVPAVVARGRASPFVPAGAGTGAGGQDDRATDVPGHGIGPAPRGGAPRRHYPGGMTDVEQPTGQTTTAPADALELLGLVAYTELASFGRLAGDAA